MQKEKISFFGVNRFPDSVGVKGGNAIRLSELEVPLWVPVSERAGRGTGGLSLLRSPTVGAVWPRCSAVRGIPPVLSRYLGVEGGPHTRMFVSAPGLDRSTAANGDSRLRKAASQPRGCCWAYCFSLQPQLLACP